MINDEYILLAPELCVICLYMNSLSHGFSLKEILSLKFCFSVQFGPAASSIDALKIHAK